MLIKESVRLLPPAVFDTWEGNTCVDATLVKAWGKRGHPKARRGRDNSADRMSPEAIAGDYVRTNPETGKAEREFGYEAHLAVMTENLDSGTIFPRLIRAMTFDRPAQSPGGNATMLLKTLRDREEPARVFAGDRAYTPGCKPINLQLPARAMGYLIVCDYRDDQLGIQAEYGGAILVEGRFYCPSMPQALIDASIDYRADRITEKVHQARIDQRARYAFRRKQAPSAQGNTVWMCPARGPGATASCALAATGTPINLGMPTLRGLTPVRRPPEHPDVCCTNTTSITIPIAPTSDDNANIAKYFQDFAYQSAEWKAAYQPARSTIEGYNGYVKTPTEEDLEQPARRRIRGYAFQAFATALIVMAANIRKIDSWVRNRDNTPLPTPTRARRRNASPDLADHLPPENGPPLAIPA